MLLCDEKQRKDTKKILVLKGQNVRKAKEGIFRGVPQLYPLFIIIIITLPMRPSPSSRYPPRPKRTRSCRQL